jgi:hypothetical protein
MQTYFIRNDTAKTLYDRVSDYVVNTQNISKFELSDNHKLDILPYNLCLTPCTKIYINSDDSISTISTSKVIYNNRRILIMRIDIMAVDPKKIFDEFIQKSIEYHNIKKTNILNVSYCSCQGTWNKYFRIPKRTKKTLYLFGFTKIL